ncbi:MAG: ABC transporter substrate-binding protein, partial [Thermodesulfobacteriota bacterium]|nr:ABC transporter substrate-binding protein [Thermodesulfobacteriota bacterium]
MNRKTELLRAPWLGLFLTGVLFCGLILSFSQTAVADDKPSAIRTANILDLTGPYAPITGPLAPGLMDAWNYVNAELGGVHGVKVESITKDFAGKMPLGLSMYNECINMKPRPIAFTPGSSPLGAALRSRFQEDGVVGITATSVEAIYPQANTFGIYPLYTEMAALALTHLKENWKEKRNPRVGIISWDTGYGRAVVTDEFYAYAKKIGVDIVGTELFGIREADVTSHLLRLRAKKADWLLTNSAASGPVAIKKGCKTMGWKVNLINSIGSDWGTVGLAPPLFENDINVMAVKSFEETDDPAIKKVMKYVKLNKRTKRDKSIFYLIGWQVALTEHYAMTKVVDKLGWKGLTPENLLKEMAQVTDFKPLGGLSEVTYSPKRLTMRKARIYRVKNGGLYPLTDFQ